MSFQSNREREKREALIPFQCVCVCTAQCTQYIIVLHSAAFRISSKLEHGKHKVAPPSSLSELIDRVGGLKFDREIRTDTRTPMLSIVVSAPDTNTAIPSGLCQQHVNYCAGEKKENSFVSFFVYYYYYFSIGVVFFINLPIPSM